MDTDGSFNPAAVLIRHTRLSPLVNGSREAVRGAEAGNEEENAQMKYMGTRVEQWMEWADL